MRVSYIKNSVSDGLFIGHELTVRQTDRYGLYPSCKDNAKFRLGEIIMVFIMF